MAIASPFNLKRWIDEHRDLLKPPVGNHSTHQHNKKNEDKPHKIYLK